jgi:hypothetical protein
MCPIAEKQARFISKQQVTQILAHTTQRKMHYAITCNRCLATEVFVERFDKVLIKRSYAYENKRETGYILEHFNISNPLSCLNHTRSAAHGPGFPGISSTRRDGSLDLISSSSVAKLQGIAASACG